MQNFLCFFLAVTVCTAYTNRADLDPLCPYPSDIIVFYPDPDDCSKYFECYQGAKFTMHCPSGLVWNPELDTCDYTGAVDCKQNGERIDSEVGGTTVWTPDPLCPYPSDDTYYYPDPDDCTKYFECFEGKKFTMNCPDGLVWNQNKVICDYVANVDCSATAAPTTKKPTTTTPSDDEPDTTTPTKSTATSTKPTAGPTTASPDQICANSADGSYLADPTDCKKFYECRGGKAYEGTCPTGTEWNESILNCDFPENVTCK